MELGPNMMCWTSLSKRIFVDGDQQLIPVIQYRSVCFFKSLQHSNKLKIRNAFQSEWFRHEHSAAVWLFQQWHSVLCNNKYLIVPVYQ